MYQCCKCQTDFKTLQLLTQHLVQKCVVKTPTPVKKFQEEEDKYLKPNPLAHLKKAFWQSSDSVSINELLVEKVTKKEECESLHFKKEVDKEDDLKFAIDVEEFQCSKTLTVDDSYDPKEINFDNRNKTIEDDLPEETKAPPKIFKNTDNTCTGQKEVAKEEEASKNMSLCTNDNFKPILEDEKVSSLDHKKELESLGKTEGKTTEDIRAQVVDDNNILADNKSQFADDNFQHTGEKNVADQPDIKSTHSDTAHINIEKLEHQRTVENEPKKPAEIIKIEEDDDENKCMERTETREESVAEHASTEDNTHLKQVITDEKIVSDITLSTTDTNTDKLQHANSLPRVQKEVSIAENIPATDIHNEDIIRDTLVCEKDESKLVSLEENKAESQMPLTVSTPKICSFCSESFSYNFQLKRHKFKKCKPFLAYKKKYSDSLASKNICKNCSLKFTNASALKTHMLVYCRLHKYWKTSVRTIARNKSRNVQSKTTEKTYSSKGNSTSNKELKSAQSTFKDDKISGSECVSQKQEVEQSAVIQKNDDTSIKNKPKSVAETCSHNENLANYCAKNNICDICFSPFLNYAALTTHKKYYCKRFGSATNLDKLPKEEENAALSSTKGNTKLLKHEADDNAKKNLKSTTSLETVKEKGDDYIIRDYDANTFIRVYTYNKPKSSHGTENEGLKNVDVVEISGTEKKTSDSPATKTNSSTEEKVPLDKPQGNISCDQCGNVFRYTCDLDLHKDRFCTKMKSVKQNLESEQICSKEAKHAEDEQNVEPKLSVPKKKSLKKLFTCPYCNSEFKTESDVSTHKMLYCKEINKKTLLAQNVDQKDTRAVENVSSQPKTENAKDKDDSSSALKVVNAKDTHDIEKSEPKRQDGIQPLQVVCCICGSEFYYQSALETHQSKYCKIFNIPRPKNTKKQKQISKSTSSNIIIVPLHQTPQNFDIKLVKGKVDQQIDSNDKIVSLAKQDVKNEEPKIPLRNDTLKSADLKATVPTPGDLPQAQNIAKKLETNEKSAEKVDVPINDHSSVNDVKRPKSPVTAPVKDPDEDKNICNICGSHFEFSFALQKHKTLYCKSFVSPANSDKLSKVTKCVDKILLISKDISKECGGDSSKSTDAKDLSKIMYNAPSSPKDSKRTDEELDLKVNDPKILVAKEQTTKEKAEKKTPKSKNGVEDGDYKCQICNATFKYEVDLSWHTYKSKYNSCSENTSAAANDVRKSKMEENDSNKSREKLKDAKACKTNSVSSVSNTLDKSLDSSANADNMSKQAKKYNFKAEEELDKTKKSGIPNTKDIYKFRTDGDSKRRGKISFDLRDTLKRKSNAGSEAKRKLSQSLEDETMNLPSTSRSHDSKFKEKRSSASTTFQYRKQVTSEHVSYDGKRYEPDIKLSSRERSPEKIEVSSSPREYESKQSSQKRKRPTYEIMEADSSSDKRRKGPNRTKTAIVAKKPSSHRKTPDSDDSLEEDETPSVYVSRVYNKVGSYKSLEPLKPSIFCEQCGTSLNNAAEVHQPTCGHHRTSFPCAVCKSYFPNINILIRHQDEEHQTDEVILKEMEKADKHTMIKYFCCLCGIDFNFIKNLIYHKVSEHKFFHRMFNKDDAAPIIRPANPNVEGFACIFCDQMLFASLKELFEHEDKSKRHKKNEKRFRQIRSNYNPIEQQRFIHICYICNLGFVSFRDLQIHMLESPEHYKLEKKCSNISKEVLRRMDKTLAKYSELKSKYLHEETKTKRSGSFPSSSRPLPLESKPDKLSRKEVSDLPPRDIQSNDLYRKVANILNFETDSVVSSSRVVQNSSFKANSSAGRLSLQPRSYSQKSEVIRGRSPESMIPVIDLSSASNYEEVSPGPSGSKSTFKHRDISEDPVHISLYHYQQSSDKEDNYIDQIDLTDNIFGRFKEEKTGTDVNQLLKSSRGVLSSDEEIEIVKSYQCYICSENFESLDHLDKHSCAGPF